MITEGSGRNAATVSLSGPGTSIQPGLLFSLTKLCKGREEGEREQERESHPAIVD